MGDMSAEAAARSARRDSSTRAVVMGGIASGLGAYAFTILGARVLGQHDYAPVGVLWTLQYLIHTVGLLSLEAYVTRTGRLGRGPWTWIAGLVVGLTTLTAVFAMPLFGSTDPVWPLAAGLIALGFGTHVAARGLSAADERFTVYGILTGSESLLRLAIAVVAMLIAPRAEVLALTLAGGALVSGAWWVLAGHGPRRLFGPRRTSSHESVITRQDEVTSPSADAATAGPSARPAEPATTATPFLASTTLANAIAQVLLAGGPLVTALLGADPAVTSMVFVTTTAARAPLVLLYSGLLARVLPYLQQATHRPSLLWPRIRKVIRYGLVALLPVAGAGFLLGPPLVAIAFGADLRPSGAFAGLTAAAVFLACAALLANQVVIALDRHVSLSPPWLLALGVAAVVMLSGAGGDLAMRAALVTISGLTVAVAGVTTLIVRTVRP